MCSVEQSKQIQCPYPMAVVGIDSLGTATTLHCSSVPISRDDSYKSLLPKIRGYRIDSDIITRIQRDEFLNCPSIELSFASTNSPKYLPSRAEEVQVQQIISVVPYKPQYQHPVN